MNLPGFDFHALRGKPKRYSVHVNGPWCITFEWEDDQPVRVDLERYHREEDMPKYAVRRPLRRCPTHPGALLREDILPALRLSIADAAERMHISRQTLHRILAERAAVTPDMALRLGKFCGNGPALWLGMQQAYDLWQAEERLRAEIKSIETARAA